MGIIEQFRQNLHNLESGRLDADLRDTTGVALALASAKGVSNFGFTDTIEELKKLKPSSLTR